MCFLNVGRQYGRRRVKGSCAELVFGYNYALGKVNRAKYRLTLLIGSFSLLAKLYQEILSYAEIIPDNYQSVFFFQIIESYLPKP